MYLRTMVLLVMGCALCGAGCDSGGARPPAAATEDMSEGDAPTPDQGEEPDMPDQGANNENNGENNGEVEVGALVLSPAVRACELLLSAPGGSPPEVSFGGAVQGEVVARSPRVAAAFHAREDAPIPAGAVRLVGGSGQWSLESARCFDQAGAPLGDDALTVRR